MSAKVVVWNNQIESSVRKLVIWYTQFISCAKKGFFNINQNALFGYLIKLNKSMKKALKPLNKENTFGSEEYAGLLAKMPQKLPPFTECSEAIIGRWGYATGTGRKAGLGTGLYPIFAKQS